jgi:ribosomal protein S18 acetylase RimI-like enzyme
MEIRPFQAADGLLLKQVRLRSLEDAPYAFGGRESLEEEEAFPDSHWHQLAADVGGLTPQWRERCVSYVVLDGDHPYGTASCFLCPKVPRRAYFSAAWIDARYRRRGLGTQLMEKAAAWTIEHGADHLMLWVDDSNPGAAEFYRALGFIPTGERKPIRQGSSDFQRSFERRLEGRNPMSTICVPG